MISRPWEVLIGASLDREMLKSIIFTPANRPRALDLRLYVLAHFVDGVNRSVSSRCWNVLLESNLCRVAVFELKLQFEGLGVFANGSERFVCTRSWHWSIRNYLFAVNHHFTKSFTTSSKAERSLALHMICESGCRLIRVEKWGHIVKPINRRPSRRVRRIIKSVTYSKAATLRWLCRRECIANNVSARSSHFAKTIVEASEGVLWFAWARRHLIIGCKINAPFWLRSRMDNSCH